MIDVGVGKATLMTDEEYPYVSETWPGKPPLYAFWSYSGTTRELAQTAAPGLTARRAQSKENLFWLWDVIDMVREIDGSESADYFTGELWLETVKERCEEALEEFGDLAVINWHV